MSREGAVDNPQKTLLPRLPMRRPTARAGNRSNRWNVPVGRHQCGQVRDCPSAGRSGCSSASRAAGLGAAAEGRCLPNSLHRAVWSPRPSPDFRFGLRPVIRRVTLEGRLRAELSCSPKLWLRNAAPASLGRKGSKRTFAALLPDVRFAPPSRSFNPSGAALVSCRSILPAETARKGGELPFAASSTNVGDAQKAAFARSRCVTTPAGRDQPETGPSHWVQQRSDTCLIEPRNPDFIKAADTSPCQEAGQMTTPRNDHRLPRRPARKACSQMPPSRYQICGGAKGLSVRFRASNARNLT